MANLTIRDHPPVVWEQVPSVEKQPRVALMLDRERTLQPPRVWHEVPIDDTLDYNEVITWGDWMKRLGIALLPLIWQQFLKRRSL